MLEYNFYIRILRNKLSQSAKNHREYIFNAFDAVSVSKWIPFIES